MSSKKDKATLNGDQATISGNERSIGGLLDTNKASVTPGNYVASDGSTIRQGEGARYTAKVNGTDIAEPRTDSNPQPVAHKTKLKVNPYTRFT